jgi:hypothetical protein
MEEKGEEKKERTKRGDGAGEKGMERMVRN